jgi:hypothetical protein
LITDLIISSEVVEITVSNDLDKLSLLKIVFLRIPNVVSADLLKLLHFKLLDLLKLDYRLRHISDLKVWWVFVSS